MTLAAAAGIALGTTFLAAGIAGAPLEPFRLIAAFAVSMVAIRFVSRSPVRTVPAMLVGALAAAFAILQHDALPQLWRFLAIAPFCWMVRNDLRGPRLDAALAYGAAAGTLLVLFG